MSSAAEITTPTRGLFIVFEGGDGCGKSTQSKRLAARLDAVHTREPGGTEIGRRIRDVVLDPEHPELADRTEALLMAADRAQHVAELIEPNLAAGRHVVSDRYVASSVAYQGVGRGLGIDRILELNRFGTGDLAPDVVVLLDIDPTAASERMGSDLDRIEKSGPDMAHRVREIYLRMANDQPDRWVVVDAAGPVDAVEQRIVDAVRGRIGDRLGSWS